MSKGIDRSLLRPHGVSLSQTISSSIERVIRPSRESPDRMSVTMSDRLIRAQRCKPEMARAKAAQAYFRLLFDKN